MNIEKNEEKNNSLQTSYDNKLNNSFQELFQEDIATRSKRTLRTGLLGSKIPRSHLPHLVDSPGRGAAVETWTSDSLGDFRVTRFSEENHKGLVPGAFLVKKKPSELK